MEAALEEEEDLEEGDLGSCRHWLWTRPGKLTTVLANAFQEAIFRVFQRTRWSV